MTNVNLTERECSGCLKDLPETTEFFNFIKYKECFDSLCIPCAKVYHREKSKIFYHQNKPKYLEYGRAKRKIERLSAEGVYKHYKYRAKSVGRLFDLTLEQFSSFWQKPCHYCDSSIETVGLDRIDSCLGYTLSNVVACCSTCNTMKMDLDVNPFIAHCMKIVARWFVTNVQHTFRI